MASNHPVATTDNPEPILHRLRDIISSSRGGNRTLLSLLTIKMDAVTDPRIASTSSGGEIADTGTAMAFNQNQQTSWQALDVLSASTGIGMPTHQFMEEQASQICWPPLDLGYLIRSPSPLTRMLLESIPQNDADEDQTLVG